MGFFHKIFVGGEGLAFGDDFLVPIGDGVKMGGTQVRDGVR